MEKEWDSQDINISSWLCGKINTYAIRVSTKIKTVKINGPS